MEAMKLTLEEATRLALLPLNCVRVEYPNKPGQVPGCDSYEGSHWLGTFAIYALQKSTEL